MDVLLQFLVVILPAIALLYINLTRRQDAQNELLSKRVAYLEDQLRGKDTTITEHIGDRFKLQQQLIDQNQLHGQQTLAFLAQVSDLQRDIDKLRIEFADLTKDYTSEVTLRRHAEQQSDKTTNMLLEATDKRHALEKELKDLSTDTQLTDQITQLKDQLAQSSDDNDKELP